MLRVSRHQKRVRRCLAVHDPKRVTKKGLSLYLIKIISSFLHSRKAELSCADTTLLTTVDLGCPQGSILSPFLWNFLVDSLLDAHFPFAYRVIAYADDLVLCTGHYDPETARRNLQYSIDHAISWGAAAKLAFNAAKTVYMLFSRRKLNLLDLPPIHVNSTPINPSSSCIYLGLTIDTKLNWREHVTKKCTCIKRLLFIVNKCCRLTWGISREKLITIYKSIFVPKLLYGCIVWGGASRQKWCIKLLRADQRPLIIAISRSFRTNSTLSALVLANISPLYYSIKERIGLKVLLQDDFPIALSSSAVVNNIITSIRNLTPPQNCNYIHFCRSALRDKLTLDWNNEWVTSDETVPHFLFHCSLHHSSRSAFKNQTLSLHAAWPPNLSIIPQNKILWDEMVNFIAVSQRFRTQ